MNRAEDSEVADIVIWRQQDPIPYAMESSFREEIEVDLSWNTGSCEFIKGYLDADFFTASFPDVLSQSCESGVLLDYYVVSLAGLTKRVVFIIRAIFFIFYIIIIDT